MSREIFALWNPRSNRFVTIDKRYELLKTIQFVLSHKILLYCVRVSDIENYRDGLLNKGRHLTIGLRDPNRVNISVDIHPKSEPNIMLEAQKGQPDEYHMHLVGVVDYFMQFIQEFNREFGYYQDVSRTRARNQKQHLEQLTEFAKLTMPDDEALLELIQFETDYKFSVMKLLRVYKGGVINMLYEDIDLECSLDDIKNQVKEKFPKLKAKTQVQRYVHPRVEEWLNAN